MLIDKDGEVRMNVFRAKKLKILKKKDIYIYIYIYIYAGFMT